MNKSLKGKDSGRPRTDNANATVHANHLQRHPLQRRFITVCSADCSSDGKLTFDGRAVTLRFCQ